MTGGHIHGGCPRDTEDDELIRFRYSDRDGQGYGHDVLYNGNGRPGLIGPHDQSAYRNRKVGRLIAAAGPRPKRPGETSFTDPPAVV